MWSVYVLMLVSLHERGFESHSKFGIISNWRRGRDSPAYQQGKDSPCYLARVFARAWVRIPLQVRYHLKLAERKGFPCLSAGEGFAVLFSSCVCTSVGSNPTPSSVSSQIGGEEGIRTPDTLSDIPDFESGAFNHSATSPQDLDPDKLP